MAQILAGVPGTIVDCDERIPFTPTRMNSLGSMMALSKHLMDIVIRVILTWPPHFQFASYGPAVVDVPSAIDVPPVVDVDESTTLHHHQESTSSDHPNHNSQHLLENW